MSRILFASSEAYPLIKTGGLADVAGSLPRALLSLKQDIRLILPAYPEARKRLGKCKTIARFELDGHNINLLQGRLPGSRVITWLIDCATFFDRPGNPYMNEQGQVWPDNAERFAFFSQAICAIATDQVGLDWQAELVHCNDWQTALVPALLDQETRRPATLFTVHNLAYQGLFDYDIFVTLGLPPHLWHPDALEFYNQLSFIKGGLVFADSINTVSPSYAEEIQRPEFGYGLDGLLRHRRQQLSGILNGIDMDEWNPGTDPRLEQNYNRRSLAKKLINKTALQEYFKLPKKPEALLFGFIGRLVEQKGLDDILASLPGMLDGPVQFVFLGSGQHEYEQALRKLAVQQPDKIAVQIGYSEELSHRIEAGADAFLMPSTFEPCGLNQLYSLRYGTLPVVRKVGGLNDTVIDIHPENLDNDSATGIVFTGAADDGLPEAIQRTLQLYQNKTRWKQVQLAAMRQDFSWRRSAQIYLELYKTSLERNPKPSN
ncbi:Glycogen synthase, ADP-glucose transglucosylase [hydrothermal vent metagenome]|uniref:starch synthase n=1 Tax=hydrothermal vent metagenome TaxID=652676 RepID=A0A3B1B9X8_9ZZZZ